MASAQAAHDSMRAQIMNAERRLLQSQSLEGITVSQICNEASVSRTTFYAHFHDKYEIAAWHFDLIAETYLYQTGRTLTWFEAHMKNSTELYRMRDFYVPVFEANGYESLFARANRRRKETLIETIEQHKHVAIDDELKFQIDALIPAETLSVRNWVLDGMPCSPKRLAELLDDIIPRRLYKLLNSPSEQPKSPFDFQR